MALLPLDPLFSHLLLKAEEFQCVDEALTAVSILSSDNLFLQPHRDDEKRAACQAHRSFASKDGDLVTLLQIYNKWLKVRHSLPFDLHLKLLLAFITHCLPPFLPSLLFGRWVAARSGRGSTTCPSGLCNTPTL